MTTTPESRIPSALQRRRMQGGFTFVSTAITTILAGVVLLGGWVAYRSYAMQMRVSWADRHMDQYAHATLQELTNLMGWGWDAVQIQGGSRNPIWKMRFYDLSTPGTDFARNWYYGNRLQDSLMTMTYTPNRGILFARREPVWVGSGRSDQYIFQGQRPGFNESSTMNRWDRITVQGLQLDYVDPAYSNNFRQLGSVKVTLTMQYRYSPRGGGTGVLSLFGEEYVRERTYETMVFMRNWDVGDNPQRKALLGG